MVLTLFIAQAAIAQNNHYPSTENSRGCEKERRRESPRAHVMTSYATVQRIHVNRHSSLCIVAWHRNYFDMWNPAEERNKKNFGAYFSFPASIPAEMVHIHLNNNERQIPCRFFLVSFRSLSVVQIKINELQAKTDSWLVPISLHDTTICTHVLCTCGIYL